MELTKRERHLLALAVGILLPLGLIRLVWVPLWDYKSNLGSESQRLEAEVSQMQAMGEAFLRVQRQQGAQASLIRQCEGVLASLGLQQAAELAMQGQGEVLSLGLDGLTLGQAVTLIHRFEDARPAIKIKTLDLQASVAKEAHLKLRLQLERP